MSAASAPPLPETNAPKTSPWRMPPGLKRSLPFYAFKKWVKLGDPIRLFEYLHDTYGNIAYYRFMGTPIIFVNDPAYIQEILVTQASSFIKERTVRRMRLLLGEGLITADDPVHMRQRKIAAPTFHRQRIAAYADTIAQCADHARSRWHPGQTLDIAAAMMELSLEIVARTLFNTEVTDEIRSINDEVNTIMDLYHFIVAMPKLEAWVDWPLPQLNQFRKSRANLDKVVYRLIREHRADGIDRGDLLSMLLASRYEQTATEAESGMTDQQVRDEVLTIFLAGYETVANALTWTWYLLSQNPEAEARLHAELDTVLGSGGQARLPTLADLPHLRYTEMVFAESMRLFPPAWAMRRMSTKPVQLGPYLIPPGSHFFFSQYIMSRTEEHYPDPLRFDPERFSPENKATRAKFAYFPFGGGGRQCIGESFAWMEGILSIATLASRYRMVYAAATPPIPQPKITLRPAGPLLMRLEPRQQP